MRPGVVLALAVVGCGGGTQPGSPDADTGPPPFTAGVSTLAGDGDPGAVDGLRAVARLDNPVNVVVGPDGRVYVADFDDGHVRAIDGAGTVETVYSASDLQRPFGLAFDAAGALWIGTDNDEAGGHTPQSGTLWKVDLASKHAELIIHGIGRTRGLAFLPDGELVVSDFLHHVVRLFDPASKTLTILAGATDVPGFADATGAEARFDTPYGIAIAPGPVILVADWGNQRIRQITLAGETTTVAGDGAAAFGDGATATAHFDHPQGLALAAGGALYVTDTDNYRVRRVAGGAVDTVAGDGTAGYHDDDDPHAARFYGLEGVAVSGDGKTVYVADGTRGEPYLPYNRVRTIAIAP